MTTKTKQRKDVGVAHKKSAPPGFRYPSEIAQFVHKNDSTVRSEIRSGKFPGAKKDSKGVWIVPIESVLARCAEIEKEAAEKASMKFSGVVYIYYNVNDVALYVGRTNTATRRMKEHQIRADWYPEYTRYEHLLFDNEEEMKKRELELIAELKPLHNDIGNGEYKISYHQEASGRFLEFMEVRGKAGATISQMTEGMNLKEETIIKVRNILHKRGLIYQKGSRRNNPSMLEREEIWFVNVQ